MANEQIERLAARVRAVNRANTYGHELYEKLVKIFTPLVGQKILKNDGQLLAKYASLMPELPCAYDLSVFRYLGSINYSLAWTVKTCETIKGRNECVYCETVVNIGNIQNHDKLLEISLPFSGRTDYTVKEIIVARENYEIALKIANDARNKLWPFGENDRW